MSTEDILGLVHRVYPTRDMELFPLPQGEYYQIIWILNNTPYSALCGGAQYHELVPPFTAKRLICVNGAWEYQR